MKTKSIKIKIIKPKNHSIIYKTIPFWLVFDRSGSILDPNPPIECYAGYSTVHQARVYASNFSKEAIIIPGKFIPTKKHEPTKKYKSKKQKEEVSPPWWWGN